MFGDTLNATQDTIAGTITQEIDLGNLYILLASGDLTLERVASCRPGKFNRLGVFFEKELQ